MWWQRRISIWTMASWHIFRPSLISFWKLFHFSNPMMTIRIITTKKSEIECKLPLKFSGSSFFVHKRMNKYLFYYFSKCPVWFCNSDEGKLLSKSRSRNEKRAASAFCDEMFWPMSLNVGVKQRLNSSAVRFLQGCDFGRQTGHRFCEKMGCAARHPIFRFLLKAVLPHRWQWYNIKSFVFSQLL